MNAYFRDYYWKNGSPKGKQKVPEDQLCQDEIYFKVIIDPYFKHISVEKYTGSKYNSTPYDSSLLDFRKLNEQQQQAWQKIVINESSKEIKTLLKNQDDRVVYLEHHRLEGGICKECIVFNPHGQKVSFHKMHYCLFGDPFNGVILYDSLMKPVLKKTYEVDESGLEYTRLIEELWEFETISSEVRTGP